jgi:hypothetical protein
MLALGDDFMTLRPSDNEPVQEELEAFLDDEDRALLNDPKVPDDVKAEIADRLTNFAEEDLEAAREDAAHEP